MMFFSPSHSSVASGLWQDWREDVACVFARDPAARGLPEVLLAYPGVHAVLLHRVSNRLWHADWKLTARLLAAFARWMTNVDIHPGATIGKRFFIDHGAGVVIGETAEIGNDVTMYHGVTLGGTTWNKEKRHPTLGNNVLIGAGAKILGAIILGDNVRVGANSVVIKDVPPCCTVIGIPGRIIQQKGIKIQDPRGIDLDHHLVPDPVGKALSCLVDRLDELENNQKRFVVAEETCGSCEAEGVCHGDDVVVLKQAAGGK
ncbi:MAG: serine O-acetyltransferase [Proteobacteria bacterium ST_bin11]|jgi:serine O-acetyltransferase|nr:MAG: serine O-acetyltransferase [Proteobacteria bacterium ST_bin11]